MRADRVAQKQALAAAVFQCRDCGAGADFECQTAKVNPPRRERRGSVDVVIQDFSSYYLCSACAAAVVAGVDPPRAVVPLPHHVEALRREEAAARRVATAKAGVAQATLGDDWGRR